MKIVFHLEGIRKAMSLTQEDLEERSGVKQGTISMIENSQTDPRVSTLAKLGKALGVNVHALFDVVYNSDDK